MPLPRVDTTFQSKYVLKSVLGEGGFATVFLGVDDIADRQVAIKVIDAAQHGTGSGIDERFVREVRVLSSLRDPHTVTMHDYGRTDDGLLYMVFEYIEGLDLEQLLEQRGRFTEPEVVHLMVQVLQSLREAHAAGLLHRDIKPANIRVFEYMGDPLRAKLLDFGIAREVSPKESKITQDGVMIGTPKYMAPEQVFGDTLTTASDIYSLGLVAFEMLAGRAAIDAPSTAEILRLQASLAPIEIPESLPVSAQFREILASMLVKHPRQRASSAEELLDRLRSLSPAAPSSPPVPTLDMPAPSRPTLDSPAAPTGSGGTSPVRAATGSGSNRPPTLTEKAQPRHDQPPPPTAVNQTRTEVSSENLVMIGVALVVALALLGGVVMVLARADEEPETPAAAAAQAPVEAAASESSVGMREALETALAIRRLGVKVASKDREWVAPTSFGCGGNLQGRETIETIEFQQKQRRWFEHSGRNYDPDVKHALILAFHDTRDGSMPKTLSGSARPRFFDATGFARLAGREPVVVITPQSLSGNHDSPVSSPPWVDAEHEIDFARYLIDRAQKTYCIDESKVFVVGHGSGARMAEHARCSLPVNAVALTSYLGHESHRVCEADPAVPVVHMRGETDGYSPAQGGEDCQGTPRISLAEQNRQFANVNGCSRQTEVFAKTSDYTCVAWKECEAPFVSCSHPQGHGWPNAVYDMEEQMVSVGPCFRNPATFDMAGTLFDLMAQIARPHPDAARRPDASDR